MIENLIHMVVCHLGEHGFHLLLGVDMEHTYQAAAVAYGHTVVDIEVDDGDGPLGVLAGGIAQVNVGRLDSQTSQCLDRLFLDIQIAFQFVPCYTIGGVARSLLQPNCWVAESGIC